MALSLLPRLYLTHDLHVQYTCIHVNVRPSDRTSIYSFRKCRPIWRLSKITKITVNKITKITSKIAPLWTGRPHAQHDALQNNVVPSKCQSQAWIKDEGV